MSHFDDDISDASNNIDRVRSIIVRLLLVSPSFFTLMMMTRIALAFDLSLWLVIPIVLFITAIAIDHAMTMPQTALKEELVPISIAMIMMLFMTPMLLEAREKSEKRQLLESKRKQEKAHGVHPN